jgi:predicted alpha-1,6-mannanase (GH76 family)
MAATLEQHVLDDRLAVSLARAVAVANVRARREGLALEDTLVTVTEYDSHGILHWRINYGPRDYLNRRGGDLIVEVGVDDAQVKRVLRGQ